MMTGERKDLPMNIEEFHEKVVALAEECCKDAGGEIKSRQVFAVLEVMAGLVYGLSELIHHLTDRIAQMEAAVEGN
jgi:hypothetical protein